MANEQEFIPLPGFGLQLEQDSHLPSAQEWRAQPIAVRERSMLALMAVLKDKVGWDRKVFDEQIVAKWREEALSFNPDYRPYAPAQTDDQESEETDRVNSNPWKQYDRQNGMSLNLDGKDRQKKVSGETFDYCIAEMRDNAKTFQARGFTEALDANACVYMSDTAVSADTKAALSEGVLPLENVRHELKDWHPGSDGKVLDLVHPSLFPLIYGRSRILKYGTVPLGECSMFSGTGEVIPESDAGDSHYGAFQWLPCEVSVNGNGKATITSYINNLHPAGNEDLYAAIEGVISAAIPMWVETILSTQCPPTTQRIERDFEDYGWGERAKKHDPETGEARYDSDSDGETVYDSDGEEKPDRVKNAVIVPEPEEYALRARKLDPNHATEKPMIPQQLECHSTSAEWTMADEARVLPELFRSQGLQVIVKLANIHLTPEKSSYDGGSWHIEGMHNEHIVASALYYYSSDNISPSYLGFRESCDREALDEYEQSRYQALCQIYGINDDWGAAVQQVGKILTREDRLLVFPNVLQHRVAPFTLEDPSRPGHRKILALFLVDPSIRIPSTANVPPQQRRWWAHAMGETGSLTQRLPVELAEAVVEGVEEFPISMAEAKKVREELMEERGRYVDLAMDEMAEDGYCFCEH